MVARYLRRVVEWYEDGHNQCHRTLPAGAPKASVALSGDDVRAIVDAADRAEAFIERFGDSFGFRDFVVRNVEQLWLWPVGDNAS
jgi:hypothetical protein